MDARENTRQMVVTESCRWFGWNRETITNPIGGREVADLLLPNAGWYDFTWHIAVSAALTLGLATARVYNQGTGGTEQMVELAAGGAGMITISFKSYQLAGARTLRIYFVGGWTGVMGVAVTAIRRGEPA